MCRLLSISRNISLCVLTVGSFTDFGVEAHFLKRDDVEAATVPLIGNFTKCNKRTRDNDVGTNITNSKRRLSSDHEDTQDQNTILEHFTKPEPAVHKPDVTSYEVYGTEAQEQSLVAIASPDLNSNGMEMCLDAIDPDTKTIPNQESRIQGFLRKLNEKLRNRDTRKSSPAELSDMYFRRLSIDENDTVTATEKLKWFFNIETDEITARNGDNLPSERQREKLIEINVDPKKKRCDAKGKVISIQRHKEEPDETFFVSFKYEVKDSNEVIQSRILQWGTREDEFGKLQPIKDIIHTNERYQAIKEKYFKLKHGVKEVGLPVKFKKIQKMLPQSTDTVSETNSTAGDNEGKQSAGGSMKDAAKEQFIEKAKEYGWVAMKNGWWALKKVGKFAGAAALGGSLLR